MNTPETKQIEHPLPGIGCDIHGRKISVETLEKSLKPTMDELVFLVRQWGIDKGITGPDGKGTLYAQAKKMMEEANETMEAVTCYNRTTLNCNQLEMDYDKPEIIDGIGDTAVTLILLAEILGTPFEQCLQTAYDVISKRTGKMVGGTFVRDKEGA